MPETYNGEVEIHFETFGDPERPTLLLVNGLGSQCINYSTEWCEMFAAEGYHVVRFDNRDVGLSSKLPDVDYAAFAASLGLNGVRVDKPGDIGPAWDRALASDKPTVLDVRTDPNIPPIPPHATFEQAVATAKALAHGDPNRAAVVVEGVKTKIQEFLPHGGGDD